MQVDLNIKITEDVESEEMGTRLSHFFLDRLEVRVDVNLDENKPLKLNYN
jgi:hypothetical protein